MSGITRHQLKDLKRGKGGSPLQKKTKSKNQGKRKHCMKSAERETCGHFGGGKKGGGGVTSPCRRCYQLQTTRKKELRQQTTKKTVKKKSPPKWVGAHDKNENIKKEKKGQHLRTKRRKIGERRGWKSTKKPTDKGGAGAEHVSEKNGRLRMAA